MVFVFVFITEMKRNTCVFVFVSAPFFLPIFLVAVGLILVLVCVCLLFFFLAFSISLMYYYMCHGPIPEISQMPFQLGFCRTPNSFVISPTLHGAMFVLCHVSIDTLNITVGPTLITVKCKDTSEGMRFILNYFNYLNVGP